MDAPVRPVIGITTYVERARFGGWDVDSALLPRSYPDAVCRAGGVPVLLPPIGAGAVESLAALDGLVLSGGADIDPARYHQDPLPETDRPQLDRDESEFELLRGALAAGLPVLAICRGMQLLNVFLGGDIVQHLPDTVGHDRHRPVPGTFGTMTVETRPDTRAAGILGPRVEVRCHHHQAVGALGEGLVPSAVAADGTVEALEPAGSGFLLGVQWHPEENPHDDRLFAALVTAATDPLEHP